MKEFRTPKGRACSWSPLGSTDANSHRISLNYIAYYLPHIFFGARAIFCSNESYRHIPSAKDDIWKYPFVILVEWPLEGLTKWYIPSCLQRQTASAIFFSVSRRRLSTLFSQKGVETWYGSSNSNVPLTDQLHNGLQLFYSAQVLHVICNYIFVSSYSVSNWWEIYLSCKSLAINRQTVH